MQNGKTKILVVDDRRDKLLVFQTILEELGQTLLTAGSGEEALKLVLEHEFAVILLDINMPGLDGLETAELIRNRKKSAHTPIIFMTAYADEMHALKGYSLGAVDYILSPVVPEILRTKVKVFVDLFRMTERAKEQAEERIQLAKAQAARAAAEEASRRSHFLAQAGAALAQSLDLKGRVAILIRLVLSELADFSAIVLLDENRINHETELGWLDGNKELQQQRRAISELPASMLKEAIERTIQSSSGVFLTTREDSAANAAPLESRDVEHQIDSLKLVSTFPLFARDRMLGILCVAFRRSRASLSNLELELANELAERAASAFDNALLYGKLQENDQRKDEFLAMLAHELRNPLSPIRNAGTVLQHTTDPEKHKWAVGIILRQVAHMVRLLDDLLDVSRITRGKIDLRLAPTDLAAIIAGAVETSRPLIEARRHQLEVMLPDEPFRIHADPTRMEQVISNLLNNAAKFTEEGGKITLSAERNNGEVICRIRDSGIGIPSDMLSSIFNLFTQVARAQAIQGSLGIGLTLVRRLVEAHGGTVYASSKGLGHGSEFVFRLPLLQESANSACINQTATKENHRNATLRIMVVDDDLDGADSTVELLRLHGCEARAFSDGRSALDALERFQPEALLLDLSMPSMDGYEVARRIRATPGGHELILVAASGHGRSEDLEKSRSAGFDGHLVKPVDPNALIETLSSLCINRQPRSSKIAVVVPHL
jgi:signal transduction histidine kinase/DNA-binding response OmpR family regulator